MNRASWAKLFVESSFFLALVMFSGCGNAQWDEFELDPGGVSILFPSDSEVDSQISLLDGGNFYSKLVAENSESAYGLSVLSPGIDAASNFSLDEIVSENTDNCEQVVEVAELVLAGYPARKIVCEYQAAWRSELYIFIAGSRLVTASIFHAVDFVDPYFEEVLLSITIRTGNN